MAVPGGKHGVFCHTYFGRLCLPVCSPSLLGLVAVYERYYYTYPVWRCSSLKDTSPTNDGPFMGKADPDVAWHPIYIGEGDAKCPSHFVYETAVKQSFMEMLYAIKRDYEENGENAWSDSEFRMVYQKVQEHVTERDSSRKAELDEQILQLEEKMAQMQGRLKEAVERGRQKASPEIDTYEYDFFIRCLEVLPKINKAGMKLNVNGLDTDGSCLEKREDDLSKSGVTMLGNVDGKSMVEQMSPQFLEFVLDAYRSLKYRK